MRLNHMRILQQDESVSGVHKSLLDEHRDVDTSDGDMLEDVH